MLQIHLHLHNIMQSRQKLAQKTDIEEQGTKALDTPLPQHHTWPPHCWLDRSGGNNYLAYWQSVNYVWWLAAWARSHQPTVLSYVHICILFCNVSGCLVVFKSFCPLFCNFALEQKVAVAAPTRIASDWLCSRCLMLGGSDTWHWLQWWPGYL